MFKSFFLVHRYADADSDLPVPTHVYAILIKCKTVGKALPCDGDIDILPFILPNLNEAPNCLVRKYYNAIRKYM